MKAEAVLSGEAEGVCVDWADVKSEGDGGLVVLVVTRVVVEVVDTVLASLVGAELDASSVGVALDGCTDVLTSVLPRVGNKDTRGVAQLIGSNVF